MKRVMVASLLALGIALGAVTACSSHATQTPTPSPANVRAGTCEASCRHYFECKGAVSDEAIAPCVAECARGPADPQTLAAFEKLECRAAIRLIEGEAY